MLSRYRDDYLKRVLAPEGEPLSFAPPKESSQRKGGPVAAHVLRSSHLSGDGKRGFLPLLPPRGIPAAPLRAVPDKCCGARRGKREKVCYCLTSVIYMAIARVLKPGLIIRLPDVIYFFKN
jgi:hypothetical protein